VSDTILEVRLLLYRVASNVPQWRAPHPNRLVGQIIGGNVVIAGRCLSLQWRRPR
jgi:hypothetical protein